MIKNKNMLVLATATMTAVIGIISMTIPSIIFIAVYADPGDCYDHFVHGNNHCTGTIGSEEPIRSCGHPNSLKDNDGDSTAGCDFRPSP